MTERVKVDGKAICVLLIENFADVPIYSGVQDIMIVLCRIMELSISGMIDTTSIWK